MYTFYYDHLKAKYGNRCTLLFTDTDSLCCHIQTPNLYEDDTSNFEKDHPLYSMENHRVLGKFNSETGSLAPREFVGLRAKMYSLECGKKSQKKAKAVKKHVVKKRWPPRLSGSFEAREINTMAKFNTFKSTNHVLNTVLQPLKLATSNLVYNLGLGLSYQKTTFRTKIGGEGLGQGSIRKKFGTPYLFLQPLKLATEKLVHNMSSCLLCQTQVLFR